MSPLSPECPRPVPADTPAAERPVTLADKIACLKREVALRRNVYPGFVARGKMKAHVADREITVMRAILSELEARAVDPTYCQFCGQSIKAEG